MALYSEWEILLAWIPNSDGTPPPYKHRCVYLMDSVSKPGAILVLGITSDESQWRAGYSVDLPYLDAPGGHPITHCVKRSIVQSHWHAQILPSEVGDVVGYVPDDLHAAINSCVDRVIADLRVNVAKPNAGGGTT